MQKEIGQRLWKKVERYAWLFALCPFVRMVAVCNSLASGKAHEGSDIDLFVVAADGRLSITRFFMKFFTQLLGIRVHHEKKAGRFCLSFFVTEKALNLEPLAYPFDPHFAKFVATMVPIYGREVYEKFLEENTDWTLLYTKQSFPARPERFRNHPLASMVRSVMEAILGLFGFVSERFFERVLEKQERAYRQKVAGRPGVVMSEDVFKTHENDPRFNLFQTLTESRSRETRTSAVSHFPKSADTKNARYPAHLP